MLHLSWCAEPLGPQYVVAVGGRRIPSPLFSSFFPFPAKTAQSFPLAWFSWGWGRRTSWQKSLKFRTRVKPEFGSQVEAEIKTNYRAAEPRPACSPGSFWSFFFYYFWICLHFSLFLFFASNSQNSLICFSTCHATRSISASLYVYITQGFGVWEGGWLLDIELKFGGLQFIEIQLSVLRHKSEFTSQLWPF